LNESVEMRNDQDRGHISGTGFSEPSTWKLHNSTINTKTQPYAHMKEMDNSNWNFAKLSNDVISQREQDESSKVPTS